MGLPDGHIVGDIDGMPVGLNVGDPVGTDDSACVGVTEGLFVKSEVSSIVG